jgi:hypothetical protein
MPFLGKKEAQLLDTIVKTERAYSSYFFVAFSGSGFDRYSRNRVFVYRKHPIKLSARRASLSSLRATKQSQQD